MITNAKKEAKMPRNDNEVGCIDLFCGVGGLSYGLSASKIDIVSGYDIDPSCEYPFEYNNDSVFHNKDITKIQAPELSKQLKGYKIKMLAGCAPCQPFSQYTRGQDRSSDNWSLLNHFSRLIRGVRPDIITMENVPRLVQHEVFDDFYKLLKRLGYKITVLEKAYCPDYGIPQTRKRLVCVASLHGYVDELKKTRKAENYKSVRDTIGKLPAIQAGEYLVEDPLHTSSNLSKLNLKRIKKSIPGGSWRDWPEELVAQCHQNPSGKTYPGVYGRMDWDSPSPTITTQFFGFGNGRFGHPQQNRAISLREGAMLQSFPLKYRFVKPTEIPSYTKLGRLIGNAVPVGLGRSIGRVIQKHLG